MGGKRQKSVPVRDGWTRIGAAADICLHFTSKSVSVAKYISDITH